MTWRDPPPKVGKNIYPGEGLDIHRTAIERGMTVLRVSIQRRELDVAVEKAPESVIRRAAQAMAVLLDGGTVIVEERIGEIPAGEEMIEETILQRRPR